MPVPTTVVVPGGTPVRVAVTDPVSSATAKVGDTFNVRSTDDIVVDGWIVVAKGGGGQGEVVSVDRAGSHGHPGNLGIKIDWIYAVDGEKIRLTSQEKNEEGKGEQGVSSTMTIVSWAFLGLPGLFAHNWVKGHDVVLDSSHPLKAYVDDTVHIAATTKADDAGFAH